MAQFWQMYWLAVTGPVAIPLQSASSGPVLAQLRAKSGLPEPAYYRNDEQKFTNLDLAASTRPIEIYSLISYGPVLAR